MGGRGWEGVWQREEGGGKGDWAAAKGRSEGEGGVSEGKANGWRCGARGPPGRQRVRWSRGPRFLCGPAGGHWQRREGPRGCHGRRARPTRRGAAAAVWPAAPRSPRAPGVQVGVCGARGGGGRRSHPAPPEPRALRRLGLEPRHGRRQRSAHSARACGRAARQAGGQSGGSAARMAARSPRVRRANLYPGHSQGTTIKSYCKIPLRAVVLDCSSVQLALLPSRTRTWPKADDKKAKRVTRKHVADTVPTTATLPRPDHHHGRHAA